MQAAVRQAGAQSGRVDMTGALRDAGFTGLMAFGVLLPLIGFLTGVDGSNQLVLTTRWPLLFAIVAVIAACRFLYCFAITPWLARRDADWWVRRLYDFAPALGATTVRTIVSRTVIDVNRDPSGASLYPGQATTDLCPVTTFDGDPLYLEGEAPGQSEINDRRARYFDPYHAALKEEIDRLRKRHRCVVLYDAHSIRSEIPRLFAIRRAECADFERHLLARLDAERRVVHRVDGRRQVLRLIPIDDLHDAEIIVDAPLGIGDLQHFTELARLGIRATDRG